MATTKYTITLRVEFASMADRDAVYNKAKTFIANEKAAGTVISLAQIQKEEYTKPDSLSETL